MSTNWDEINLNNERLRARYAILANPGTPIKKVMSTYMVRPEVAQEYIDGKHDLPDMTDDVSEETTKRVVKWDEFYKWLDDHVGETLAPKQIARATGFSTSTVRKFIRKNPDRLVLATKARWTIVNPNGKPAKKVAAKPEPAKTVKKAEPRKAVKKAAPAKKSVKKAAPAKRRTTK